MKKLIVSLLILCANLSSASSNYNYYERLFTKVEPKKTTRKIDPKKLDISIRQRDDYSVNVFYLHKKQGIAKLTHRINKEDNRNIIIDEIHVCKKYRGKGIGTHILKNFLEIARDHGYLTCSLQAVPLDEELYNKKYKKKLEKLIKWYKSFGFKVTKHNMTDAEMQKNLY